MFLFLWKGAWLPQAGWLTGAIHLLIVQVSLVLVVALSNSEEATG